jgi:hypothetical protein
MTKLILQRTTQSVTKFETPTGGTSPLVISSKLRFNDSKSTFEFKRIKCFSRDLRALGMTQWVSESELFTLQDNDYVKSKLSGVIYSKTMFMDYLESKYKIELTNKNKLKILNTKTNATHSYN